MDRAIRARRRTSRPGFARRSGRATSNLRSILVCPAGEPLLDFIDQLALVGRALDGEAIPFGRVDRPAHEARNDRAVLDLELDDRLAARLEALAACRELAVAHRALQLQQRLLGVEGWRREAPIVGRHRSCPLGQPALAALVALDVAKALAVG